MTDKNTLSTERKPSPEQLTAAVNAACQYNPLDEQQELARLTRMCGPVRVIGVRQDFQSLVNQE